VTGEALGDALERDLERLEIVGRVDVETERDERLNRGRDARFSSAMRRWRRRLPSPKLGCDCVGRGEQRAFVPVPWRRVRAPRPALVRGGAAWRRPPAAQRGAVAGTSKHPFGPRPLRPLDAEGRRGRLARLHVVIDHGVAARCRQCPNRLLRRHHHQAVHAADPVERVEHVVDHGPDQRPPALDGSVPRATSAWPPRTA
jgi:hypothetical protein